jgi:CHAT domain-containing protein
MKSRSIVVVFISGFLFLLIAWFVSLHHAKIKRVNDEPGASEPQGLLDEANRFSWLGNWYRALPLYQEAEDRFHSRYDLEGEIYARVGRIRAEASHVPVDRTLLLLNSELDSWQARANPRLRLWCLALKGSLEIDSNSNSAKRDWIAAKEIATSLGEEQWVARASGELGILAFLDGNTAFAVSSVGKAILSAYRTGDIASQIRMLSMLGLGFNEEKRYSEALTMFKRAIATAETTPDAGFPFLAYRGEAATLIGLHETEQAKKLLTHALATARAENDFSHEAELMVRAGEAAMAENRIGEAQSQFLDAGRIAEKLNLYRTVDEAMFDLAAADRQLNDTNGAMSALRAGLKASQRLGDRYYVPRNLAAQAELKAAAHKPRDAERMFEQAEDVLDGILVHEHSFEESTAHAGAMSDIFLEHFRVVQTTGSLPRAFHIVERVRGRMVASRLYAHDKNESNSPGFAALEGKIAATQLTLLRSEDKNQRAALLERLLEDERHLAFELNQTGLDEKEMLAAPASLPMVQAALTRDEVLAEYVLDEPNSFCIVVTRESARMFILAAGKAQIQHQAELFLKDLKLRQAGDLLAENLYGMLLEPILNQFHKSRLIISPDGILYSLPFEALRRDGYPLVRSETVSYAPSATVLCRLRSVPNTKAGRSLLAVGAVDYKVMRAVPHTVERGSLTAAVVRGLAELAGSRLEDLPGSRDEVLSIAHVVGNDPEMLLGQDATESKFKSEPLANFRVIHLAVHATTDPLYPDRAALVLGVKPNTSDDGLLQVREIMRLPLNASLVTLSACETEVGTFEGEAGVVSLERAFLIAGARAVVASLWNVEDSSTTALMKGFYAHLARHEDKATALANAKRDLLDRYGHLAPYYWAAFVMVGEGSENVSFGL